MINHQSVGSTHIVTGFKPAYLIVIVWQSTSESGSIPGTVYKYFVYDADVTTTKLTVGGNFSTGINTFRSIDDDGFTINGFSYTLCTYFAVSE